MQDPKHEIVGVVKSLIEAPDATAQKATLQKYFAPDASFDHPLCAVRSSPNSRDSQLLPIYQWLKIMLDSTIVVNSVALDDTITGSRLFVDASQKLKPRLLSRLGLGDLYAPVARLVVVLHLVQAPDSRYYIARQEDIYQIQELPGKFGEPFLPLFIMLVKFIATFNVVILAFVFQNVFGIWRPKDSSSRSRLTGKSRR